MTKNLILALDKSVRRKDVDGRLYIESSPISKACVSPYLGHEIPDNDILGLQPDRIYYLLRDPIELAKAADSFRGLPILIQHKPTSADDHPQELTVGAIGSEVVFNAPYLEAPLCIWTEEAIAGIETRVQQEISSGYRYTADMTPGTYEGVQYDGVMRNIQGNHIALVDVGRAGPDVVVHDQNPNPLRLSKMRLSRAAVAASSALRAYLTPKLAQDAAIGSLGALMADVKAATFKKQKPEIIARVKAHMVGKLAADAKMDDMATALDAVDDDDMADDDEETEEEKKKREAEEAEKAKSGAQDDDPQDDPKVPKVTKGAMDAAIDAAVKGVHALHQARRDVAPLVGEVALDSAEQVYKFALDQLGVDVTGVHASAYRAMVMLAADRKPVARIAQDAASIQSTGDMFPALSRFTHA